MYIIILINLALHVQQKQKSFIKLPTQHVLWMNFMLVGVDSLFFRDACSTIQFYKTKEFS